MAVCTVTASLPTRFITCSIPQTDPITPSSPFKLPLFWPWQKVQKVKVGPLSVSPMGFGTWAWGNQLLWGYQESMDSELQQVFNLAVDNGINLFDTADSYGTGKLNGQSEKLLGQFIQEYKDNTSYGLTVDKKQGLFINQSYFVTCAYSGGIVVNIDKSPDYKILIRGTGPLFNDGKKRIQDDIVIATKFAAYPWRLTPGQFVDACRSSIERLQLEQIGIGQLHWSTANYAPLQERALWDGLVAMYEKGLVQAVGVSNYGPKQLVKIHNYLKDRGVPLRTAQVQFSLLSYGDEQMEIMNVCNSLGVQLIAYSPLGLGMLTGKYTSSNLPTGPRGLLFRQILPGLEPLLSCLRDIARRRQKTMSQVAINWCMSKGTIPIPGVKTVKQVQDNLGALGWRLTSKELSELEDAARESPRKMVQNIFQTR